MEWLNMLGSHAVRLWLAQAAVIFFLISGAALLVFGISLIINSSAALRFISRMNQWVSFRAATKSLEVPRDTRSMVLQYRYAFAAVFVAGGLFVLYGLLTQFNTRAAITLLGLHVINPRAADWLAESLRWALVLGNALAVLAGVMLAFFPERVSALEALGGKWISSRQATKGGNDMHMKMDGWVATHPRESGGVIVLVALVMIGIFGMMVSKIW
jgi:hypothetical protein